MSKRNEYWSSCMRLRRFACRAGVVFGGNRRISHPASARSHHGAARYAHARYAGHHARRHYANVISAHRARIALACRRGAMQMRGCRHHASLPSSTASGGSAMFGGFGASSVVVEARRPAAIRRGVQALCVRGFQTMVLQHSDRGNRLGSGAFVRKLWPASVRTSRHHPVMGRGGGGHVGIVSGIDAGGNPILVSATMATGSREAPISRGPDLRLRHAGATVGRRLSTGCRSFIPQPWTSRNVCVS